MPLCRKWKRPPFSPQTQTVFISHGDCLADAEYVANRVREKFGVKNIYINFIGPVIGAHSGPGTVALFFIGVADQALHVRSRLLKTTDSHNEG